MSFSPKPCAHCGGTAFHVLPDVLLEANKTVPGMQILAAQSIGFWKLTVVVCVQCTRTEFFTPNVNDLMKLVPGAYSAVSTR